MTIQHIHVAAIAIKLRHSGNALFATTTNCHIWFIYEAPYIPKISTDFKGARGANNETKSSI